MIQVGVNVGPPPVYGPPIYNWGNGAPRTSVSVQVSVSYDEFGNPLFNNSTNVAVTVTVIDNNTGAPSYFDVPPHGFVRPEGDWRSDGGYSYSAYRPGDNGNPYFLNGGGFRPDSDCFNGGCPPSSQTVVQVYVQVDVNQPPVPVEAYDCGPGRIFVGGTVYVTGSYDPQGYQGVPLFVPAAPTPNWGPYSYDVAGGSSFSAPPPIFEAGGTNMLSWIEQPAHLAEGAALFMVILVGGWLGLRALSRRAGAH